MPSTDEPTWVPIGLVVRPHGIRGELRVKLHNADSEVLQHVPTVRVRMPSGSSRDLPITRVRPAATGILLLSFPDVVSRDDAEEFRGAELSIPRDQLPAPDEDEFYICDLIGARAVLLDGTAVGDVIEVRTYPATTVLVIRGDGTAYEVPLIDNFVQNVDVAGRRVVLHTVDGMETS